MLPVERESGLQNHLHQQFLTPKSWLVTQKWHKNHRPK